MPTTEVVHRDIKPSNLMVDAGGVLWITDFGLAMIQGDPALNMTGDILGTLRYMSPEQALGNRREMDHRTDIYSLGVTLYELLTLQPPWGVDRRLIRQLVEEDHHHRGASTRRFPATWKRSCSRRWPRSPRRLRPVAREFADDLRRFLAHEPILRPASVAGRPRGEMGMASPAADLVSRYPAGSEHDRLRDQHTFDRRRV